MKRCLCFMTLLLLTQISLAQSAADKLNNMLSSVQTLRANYVQTTTDPRFNKAKIQSGSAILRRPKMFRWSIEKPYRQLLVADGENLYIYDEDLAQVTVQPMGDSYKDTPALIIVGDTAQIESHFTVHELDADAFHTSFRLIPKDEGALLKSVVISFTGSALTKLWMQDNLDQIISITFTQVSMNDPLPQDLFRFKMPKNVDIINGDSHARS